MSYRQRTFRLASRTTEQENMFHATYSRRRKKQAVARSKQIFATFAFCSANLSTHFHERKHESAGTSRNGHIDAQRNKSCRLDVNNKQQTTVNDVLPEHHGRRVRVRGSLSNHHQHQRVHKRHRHRHQRLYRHQQQWQRQQQHAYTHQLLVTTKTMCTDFIITHNNQPSRWPTMRVRDGQQRECAMACQAPPAQGQFDYGQTVPPPSHPSQPSSLVVVARSSPTPSLFVSPVPCLLRPETPSGICLPTNTGPPSTQSSVPLASRGMLRAGPEGS